ncbi:MAG: SRPBCC domain-containing protein [Gaiellaceae bacterium]
MSDAIVQEVTFDAPPSRVYEAMMNPDQHAEFTAGGAVEMDRDEGGAFSAHGGKIAGRNIELVPDQRIVQAWRPANWPDGQYSVVRFELQAENGGTKLTMTHSGVPAESQEMIGSSWHSIYWEPLAKYLA